MEKSDVEILGSWASPFSNRVQIALNLKSIDYEFREVNFYSNKSERLLKSNPIHKKIPVLIHNNKPICESSIILQYIDEVWADKGPPILPSDPCDRAAARFWAIYIDEKWLPLFKELVKASGYKARGEIMANIVEGLMFLEEAFVECSKGEDFFGGDDIGYVDIVLGSGLGWIKVSTESANCLNFFDETRTPGLSRWARRFVAHNAAKDVVPETSKLLEFFLVVLEARAALGLKY